MNHDGDGEISAYEQVLDLFIAQLDTIRGRAILMAVAALAVVAAGYELAMSLGDGSLGQVGVWSLIVLGNLVMVYVLTVYQKPPGAIEREVLSD